MPLASIAMEVNHAVPAEKPGAPKFTHVWAGVVKAEKSISKVNKHPNRHEAGDGYCLLQVLYNLDIGC